MDGWMDGWAGSLQVPRAGPEHSRWREQGHTWCVQEVGGSWGWREPGVWVESQAGKASGASRGEDTVGGVEDALEVSLGKPDSSGPINSGAGQESGMEGAPF